MKYPNLRKRGKAYYYDHGGQPRRWEPLGTDEPRAMAKYRRIREQAKPEAGTVDKMLADYLARPRAPLAAGTVTQYKMYRRHLSAVFGHQAPDELTQGDVVRYLRKCPRTSARNEIGLLSLAYVAWIEEERLSFNPCFGVKIKLPVSRRTRLLTHAELDAIIVASDERLAVAIELAYATGLRVSDLVALRWADLTASKQTQKTGARQTFAPSAELDAILTRCRALQARVASLYVLCGRGGAPYTPGALPARWKLACARAGVEDANWHDIRARRATDAEIAGDNPQTVLGHRHRQTTETYLRDRRANVVKPLARRRG